MVALRELRAGRDTNDEDVKYFNMFRSYYIDFEKANLEITDPKFRKKANETEQMCRYLQLFLNEHKTLEKSVYIQVLERIQFLLKQLLSSEEMLYMFEILEIE